jgi:hypothetical protein
LYHVSPCMSGCSLAMMRARPIKLFSLVKGFTAPAKFVIC